MNRKEIDLLLARIEGLKSFLEKNSLEDFQKEILRVDNYLKRFGSLEQPPFVKLLGAQISI